MDYEKWYKDAIESINQELSNGQTFEVKSLFLGTKWNTLTPGEKKSFGRYFSSKVTDGDIPNVARYGENKSHHNKYIKVDNTDET